jgi:hypothetical protein
MEGWVVELTGVGATGDVTQLYPAWAAAGAVPGSATLGDQIRQPIEGQITNLQIRTDGTNGGIIELYDINGADAGADVSSLTAITDAQLDAAIAAGTAKLIYTQNFISSPETPINMGWKGFSKGLAARNVGSGLCYLNMVVNGGYRYITKL